jgi:hypothetical protein
MSRAMKPRSVAMELPASGAVLPCLHQLLGGRQVHGGCPYLFDKPRAGVHLGHHVDHRRQRRIFGVDHHVDPVAKDIQVSVGDQDGDLDQPV